MTEDGRPLADQDGPQRSDQPQTGDSAESGGDQQASSAQQDDATAEPQRGRMRHQDAETATPREPTLAEKRARIAAEKRQEEQAQAELAEAERKTQVRRRVMVGSGVTVGVVALVAAFYSGSAYSEQRNAVQQYCASDQAGQARVEDADFCDENYVHSHGGHSSGGMFFMPIVLPGGGFGGWNSYRYGYSQPGTLAPPVGGTVSSPNYTKPGGTTIKDTKGQTVQRGGFGINSKSGSSGS